MAIPAARGLSHIGITSADMDRSVRFYSDVFGLEVQFELEFSGPDFEEMVGIAGARGRVVGGQVGDVRLEFITMNFLDDAGSPGFGLSKLSFEVTSADEAFEQLRELGIEAAAPPHEVLGTRSFSIQDPDGTIVDLIEYVAGGNGWGGQESRWEFQA